MTDWVTKWETNPNYPGWRKRKLVSPDGMMTALLGTFWERIPGSDPDLPPPPEARSERRPMPPNRINPPWGGGVPPKRKTLPNWLYPPKTPPKTLPNRPNLRIGPPTLYNRPEMPGRYNMPDFWDKIPEEEKGRNLYNMPEMPINEGRQYNMPSPYPKGTLEHMVPLGGGGGGINPPWANMLKPDMTRDITIPPARRRHFRGTEDPATGQNRLIKSDPTYPDQSDNFKKMQDIQEAYFSGADFGYEEGWPERLKVSEQMINMFMSTPEEAIIFAFENPTDAVLEEFERNYGWPLNVNSPALRKYVMQMKGQNGV